MQIEPAAHAGHQTETWDAGLVPDERGRTRHPSPDCPVEVALAAVAGRWTTLVLRELMHGPQSFSSLRASLPSLSAKVLADRLHTMTGCGLVSCQRTTGFPVRTTYRLTQQGLALRPLLIALYDTGSALLEHRSRSGPPAAAASGR
ncbi:MAG: helix-turn-helix domain-containing protein [Kibdelosporangium sp.]